MSMTVPKTLPNYEVKPLRSDNVTIAIVQCKIKEINPANAEKERKENLDYMTGLVDRACRMGRKDLIVFHEYPLSGFNFGWTREQALKIAIDVPGPETEALGKKAKQYNCYIHTGCYGKLKDWPNHFTNMGIIIGPSGEVIYKRWKLRNLSGMGFSTTVHDVLDEYVKKYGWDEVFPVARTDIGNIAILPEIFEPEAARAFAIRGCEIMIRYMTAGNGFWTVEPVALRGGGFDTFRVDFQACCMQNGFYGVFVNNSVGPDDSVEFGAGGSSIYDNDGRLLVEASSVHDTIVEAVIPMANYRKKHSIPKLPKELYTHVWDEYQNKFPPNVFTRNLPNGISAAGQAYAKEARW